MISRFILAGIWVLASAVPLAWAQAETDQADPYALVREVTGRVMTVVAGADEYVQDDPEHYYQQIDEALDEFIDYRSFARAVMGDYASSARYRSLDDSGRALLRDQLDRFTEVMHRGLIRTYSKGLLAYANADIDVPSPPDRDPAARRASVRQLIHTGDAEPYVILYQMKRSRSGQWLLANVIIDGVNLGEIYRNQFQSEASKFEGRLDDVIANWSVAEIRE